MNFDGYLKSGKFTEVYDDGKVRVTAVQSDGWVSINVQYDQRVAKPYAAQDIVDTVMYDTQRELQFCDECGAPMVEGYSDGCNVFCEDCFKPTVETMFGGEVRPTDEEGWLGGFYEWYDEESGWQDTGFYYTEWR